MSLPDDVFDLIFGFLQSDIAALKACSQSHSNFSHLVERYLYATVSLYDNDTISENGLGTLQFIRFISKNPHVANYIRGVKVQVTSYQPARFVDRLEGIAYVLRMCSFLNQITLEHTFCSWHSLSEDFRLTLLHCLSLPSLRTVYISYVPGFPLAALNNSKSMKSLTLIGWTPDRNVRAEPSSHPFFKFENLSIQNCVTWPALQTIVDWVQPHNLQSLDFSLSCGVSGISQFSRLLSKCSNTLKTLNINVNSRCKSFAVLFSLEGHVSNRCLTVPNHYEYEMGFVKATNHPIAIPLRLSSLTCLENLTISNHLVLQVPERPDTYKFTCSIDAIALLLETAPPQRFILAFDFNLKGEVYLPDDPKAFWAPLVSLISKYPSTCTTVRLRETPGFGAVSLERVYSSLISITDLLEMVERGVLVIIPIADQLLGPT